MRIDRNARLCSKDIQSRVHTIREFLTRQSLHYCIGDNLIEVAALGKALKAVNDLCTRRTSQLPID